MKKNVILALGLTFLTMTVAGAQQPPKQVAVAASAALPVSTAAATVNADRADDTPVLKRRNPRYQLRAGDVLDLNFPLTPEFNQTVTIQPDGFIVLNEMGDIHVQGLTTSELTETLQKAYAHILHEPVINVVLRQFEEPFFIAGGEVMRPGKYDLRGDTTVAEAVAIAGGFKDTSKHSQVLLIRRFNEDEVEVKVLNIKKMLNSRDMKEDAHLQPGDMIFVPQNTISKLKGLILPRIGIGPSIVP